MSGAGDRISSPSARAGAAEVAQRARTRPVASHAGPDRIDRIDRIDPVDRGDRPVDCRPPASRRVLGFCSRWFIGS